MENAVKLCGLWKQKSKKDGKPFLSGRVGPTASIVVFPNAPKRSDKSPDYVAYLVSQKAKTDGATPEEEPF